jgi:hypothetical protein
MKPPVLPLTAEHIQPLTELTSRAPVAVKTYRRAAALLALQQGQCYSAVGRHLGVRYATVARGAKQFAQRGLVMLYDQPHRGRPLAITGPERAALTALACSPAPDGHSQWSLRLLAGKAVDLGLCHRLSASSAYPIELRPDRKRPWCIGQRSSEYLCRMESLLTRYAQPYDPRFPVVCFDERPCCLLGNVVEGLAPSPQEPASPASRPKRTMPIRSTVVAA